MRIVNLTPHLIKVGETEYPASGRVLRLVELDEPAGEVEGHPVIRRTYSLPELPAEQPGVMLLVSAMLLPYCRGRGDVYAPDTGSGAVRDAGGRLIGTRQLIAAPRGGGE